MSWLSNLGDLAGSTLGGVTSNIKWVVVLALITVVFFGGCSVGSYFNGRANYKAGYHTGYEDGYSGRREKLFPNWRRWFTMEKDYSDMPTMPQREGAVHHTDKKSRFENTGPLIGPNPIGESPTD